MEELKLEYYFKEINDFSYKEIFDNCEFPWEVLAKIKDFLYEKIEKEKTRICKGEVGDFCSITGEYFIDERTKIHSNVSIEGPVLIGKNVTIQSGALIRPGTIIGDNAVVRACLRSKT